MHRGISLRSGLTLIDSLPWVASFNQTGSARHLRVKPLQVVGATSVDIQNKELGNLFIALLTDATLDLRNLFPSGFDDEHHPRLLLKVAFPPVERRHGWKHAYASGVPGLNQGLRYDVRLFERKGGKGNNGLGHAQVLPTRDCPELPYVASLAPRA